MKPITIRKAITIAAPATQVWRYVGAAAGLRQWWGVEVTMEERVGGRCEEHGVQNGRPYRLVGEVTVYEPPRRLALSLQRQGAYEDGPIHTELEITLDEQDAHTTVAIVHRAFAAESAISVASVTNAAGQGPLMALPNAQSTPLPALIGLDRTTLATGAALLHGAWRHQQAQQWQQRLACVHSLVISALQQEVMVA